MALIKNLIDLAGTEERAYVLDILEGGLLEVLPGRLFEGNIKYDPVGDILFVKGTKFKLKNKRLFVLGAGKASGDMARKLVYTLGSGRVTIGKVISIEESVVGPVKIIKGDHPIPGKDSLISTREILDLKNEFNIGENDIIICLISGGGSSMLEDPLEGISMEDLAKTNELLLASGANIIEMNTIRKHLSKVKGGGLAKYFHPAEIITLAISDVLGDDPGSIASGPTYPDKTTFSDTAEILLYRGLLDKVPNSIMMVLEKGDKGDIEDTPDKLDNTDFLTLASIQDALHGMRERATALGLKVDVLATQLDGEPEDAVFDLLETIVELGMGSGIFLWGGETSPVIPEEHGIGGRNQQMGLILARELLKTDLKWTLGTLATDGSDYMDDVAGCIIDPDRIKHLETSVISSHIENFDSNSLLKELENSLIRTGPTGTNVGDIGVLLIK